MDRLSTQPIGPKSFGATLDAGFHLYRKAFVPLTLTMAIIAIPAMIIGLLNVHASVNALSPLLALLHGSLSRTVTPVPIPAPPPMLVVLGYVVDLASLLSYAAAMVVLDQTYRGGQANIGAAYAQAGRRYVITFLVLIIVAIAVMVGTVFIIVPGIILAVYFSQTMFLAVLDGAGFTALRRSWQMVNGYFWRVLGIAVVTYIVYFVVSGLVTGFAGSIVVAVAGFASAPAVTAYVVEIVASLLSMAIVTFPLAALYVLYMDLRTRKEGLDINGTEPTVPW